jgi:alkanesulfonate monooxygenase SsuD/methylene tetrahydromethanopterin reductase-like flavin-dependent oxidoreductase (luciferase family)
MAIAAEAAGFDSVWVGDHLLYRGDDGETVGPWEAWSMLAALAAVTERVALGPLVAATAFHSPAMLAKKAATVDEISGGRLVLGLGAGWNEAEFRAFGFPYDRRYSRFAEAFTIIRTLLHDGEIDFDGEFYRVEDCVLLPRGPRPHGPPLMIGSMGERMLRLTLPHVAAWNVWFAWFGNTPEGFAGLRSRIDEACAEVGRDPDGAGAPDATAAVLVSFGGGGRHLADAHNLTDFAPLAGSPAEIAAVLGEFAAAGAAEVQLVLDPITVQSIERCGAVLAALDGG